MNPAPEPPFHPRARPEGKAFITVAIVDDDDGVRDNLGTLINRTPGLRCVCASADCREAMLAIPKARPDVVLMDIRLKTGDGIECVRRLKTMLPEQTIVMLTAYGEEDLIFDALAAGASGYLLKQSPPSEILAAIIEVHEGGAPMSSNIARKVIQSFHEQPPPSSSPDGLTARETRILDHLAKGYSLKEITDLLGISLASVDYHLRGIYTKLHVHSRAAAVAKYRD